MTPALLALPLAKTGEAAKAGPLGLVVILVLCIACYFLFKSMSKHMRRVREQFPAPPPAGAAETAHPAEAAHPAGTAPPAAPPQPQPDDPRP